MTLYWSWKPQISQIQKRILINDVDIGKTVVSNRSSLGKKGFKYFNRYTDGKKVRSLCVMLMST